jgi:hypothetical protein
MLEGTIPCDVATELRGAIEVTITDDILRRSGGWSGRPGSRTRS